MTVVAQIQNLRGFITTQLCDVIDWGKHVEVDQKRTTGDIAYVEIKTPFNRYRLSMGSAYADPPHGAPDVCRSLGWVTFEHVGDDKRVLGPKNDNSYTDISKHIHTRELTDALAAVRSQMAEALRDEAGAIRNRFREIASKAERWGIKASLPEEPLPSIAYGGKGLPASLGSEQELRQLGVKFVTENEPAPFNLQETAALPPPFVGAPVIYYGSDRIAGMDQIPGVLVKFQADGRAAMFLMADLNEITFMDNIYRRGTDAGNGRVHLTNCWDFNPEWLREQERIRHLEEAIEKTADECNADRKLIDDLIGRVIALESAAAPKRKRA